MKEIEIHKFDDFLDDEKTALEPDNLDWPTERVHCAVCSMPIDNLDEAYVEILHSDDDYMDVDFGTIHHLEFIYLVHAPRVNTDPKAIAIDERFKNSCFSTSKLFFNDHNPSNISYILFPTTAITHYDERSISWQIEGKYRVKYHLTHIGLPAWDDTMWGLEQLGVLDQF